jgi:hypothetical protein
MVIEILTSLTVFLTVLEVVVTHPSISTPYQIKKILSRDL